MLCSECIFCFDASARVSSLIMLENIRWCFLCKPAALTWIIKMKTNQSPIASFNTFHWISYSMTNMAVKSWMRLMMCRPTYFDVIHKVGHVNWYLVNFIIYYWFPFSIKADKITNHNAHGSKQTVLLCAFGSWSWYVLLLKAYCSPKSIPNS